MRLSGVLQESLVDGPGLRFVLFTQGCPHACQGCHNEHTWDLDGGYEMTINQLYRILRKQNKFLQGVTFSGGEPFLQSAELVQVADFAHDKGWDVVTYTGYTYDFLASSCDKSISALLNATDILIDGTFNSKLKDISLRFRGSSNQRIIDLAATRRCGRLTLAM